jgi:hypothetical protein
MSQGSTLANYQGRDRKLAAAKTAVLIVDAQNAELTDEIRKRQPDFYGEATQRALPAMKG